MIMSLNSEMKAHMDAVRKVTGVSGLLNLASSTDSLNNLNLFKFKTVGGELPADGISHVAIEAPDIDGYTFVFWLNSASVGNVNSSYVETPTAKSTNIWATGSYKEWFQSTAVYVKSGFVSATGGGGSKCFPKISKRFNVLLSLTICKGGVTLVA